MLDYQHPSELEPKLSRAHLDVVCNNLLDAAYKALEATSTDDDTNWTRGIFPYGRVYISRVTYLGSSSSTTRWISRSALMGF
jgi:hypothetical protein